MNNHTQWKFSNPVQVMFGRGIRSQLAELVAHKAVLAVSTPRGRRQMEADPILGEIASTFVWSEKVTANPGLRDIQEAAGELAGENVDVVVAFGGGSAMDFAKGIAALLRPGSDGTDLRQLIATPGLLDTSPPLPIIALPTTSGTGSEVTPFATVWDHENKKKLSLAHPSLFSVSALVDPELTDGLPADATFSSGLDALNQAFESVWNKNSSPVTIGFAARAISLAIPALRQLAADLGDTSARDALSEASLLAGLCISQTRTALCHSMSYPLTAHFGISHGYACAFSMPEVFALAHEFMPELFAPVIAHTGHTSTDELLDDVRSLVAQLGVVRVVTEATTSVDDLLALTGDMFTPGRSDNFVAPVDEDTLTHILRNCYA